VSSFRGFNILTPRRALKATFDMMQLSAEALKVLLPGRDSRVVWQEFQNKLQAYDLFENVDSALALDGGDDAPLSQLVARARGLEAFRAVWATEGVGHYYAETRWARTGTPTRLLRGRDSDALPAGCLAALHAGMGLSLAARLLGALGPCGEESEMRDALRRYVELCRDNSRDGYVGAAYEALGLVARNLHPHLVAAIDRQLPEVDERLVGYFWHGVGRGIYFAPTNFLPLNSSPWRGVELTQREPPHETGRLNALAGLAWAVTLVNIRQPEILEAFVSRHACGPAGGDAISNGVSSAVIIWRDTTGGDSHLDAFCRHRPDASEHGLVGLWERQVARPCRDALRRFYPAVREHGCFGELFRYRPLHDLGAAPECRRDEG
jgi:hypothetical protein